VQIRPEQLRFFCLYWDYIIQPVAPNVARWKRSKDEIILEEASLLIKHHLDLPENTPELYVDDYAYSMKVTENDDWLKVFLDSQVKSLQYARKKHSDVIWTPQQSFRSLSFNERDSIDIDAIQLELHKKLPTPTSNISIKKIIEFKHTNQELFSEFKFSIDKLTNFVAQDGVYSEYSLNLAMSDIDKILTELLKASKFKWGNNLRFDNFNVVLGSPSLSILLSSFVKGGSMSYLVSESPIIAAIGGAANSLTNFFNLKPVKTKRLNCIPAEQLELGYLTKAIKSVAK
jgi:hypothetical protein